MLNGRGPIIEHCGTPLVILSYSLIPLTWQSINHGLMCQGPLKGPWRLHKYTSFIENLLPYSQHTIQAVMCAMIFSKSC